MTLECLDLEQRESFVPERRLLCRAEDGCSRILRVVHGRRLGSKLRGPFEEAAQEACVLA
jgi:hypothetical protein